MESALIGLPIVISSLMTTVAPMALVMTGGEIDRERLARGLAQFAIVSARSVAEVTYDDLLLDDRTGDLPHCLAGSLQRRQPFLAHDAFDIFNDHDGIIHKDTDSQDHAKK